MPGGYNGAGTWERTFNWVQDAANGVKILATRQDTEWANVTSGFNLAMTRDGQAVWTGNQNAGGFGITNAASGGTTATNVATIADIQVNSGQWRTETTSVGFQSSIDFIVFGVDHTTTYTKGRRVRITHNSGATITNGTVTASVFTLGNTFVDVAMDGSVALVSTVTAVQYSVLLSDQIAVPFGSLATGLCGGSPVSLTSSTTYPLGTAPFNFFTLEVDPLSELSATGVFTATYAGWYQAVAYADISRNTATLSGAGSVFISKTGTGSIGQGYGGQLGDIATNETVFSASCQGIFYIPAGGTLIASVFAPAFTGGPLKSNQGYFQVLRVR